MFYFIARQCGFGKKTWIGADTALLASSTTFERYVYSLYWYVSRKPCAQLLLSLHNITFAKPLAIL